MLENSLRDFPGALVLVTHDRYLLDRLCGTIVGLDGKGGHGFFGGLEQWEEWKARRTSAPKAKPAEAEEKTSALSHKEASELRNIDSAIHAAEKKVETALAALHDPAIATDAEELHRRQDKVDEARAKVNAVLKRWEELESRARG